MCTLKIGDQVWVLLTLLASLDSSGAKPGSVTQFRGKTNKGQGLGTLLAAEALGGCHLSDQQIDSEKHSKIMVL